MTQGQGPTGYRGAEGSIVELDRCPRKNWAWCNECGPAVEDIDEAPVLCG